MFFYDVSSLDLRFGILITLKTQGSCKERGGIYTVDAGRIVPCEYDFLQKLKKFFRPGMDLQYFRSKTTSNS